MATIATETPAPAQAPLQVYNHDIVGMISRIQRFFVELQDSSSSGVNMVTTADQARLQSYLAALTAYQAWVVASPQLDLPETNRTLWSVAPLAPIVYVDNDSINDLLRMLNLMCLELLSCQSSTLPAGLTGFDAARLTSYIAKAGNFLTAYIQVATPLDLPESSPSAPASP